MTELFVFDVDGTLSIDNSPLTDLDKREINKLLSHGYSVAIASGRPLCGIKVVLNQLMDSPNKFAICANGAEVFDGNGKQISKHCLKFKDYLHIYNRYKSKDRTIYLYKGNVLASFDKGKFIDMEYNWNFMERFIDLNKVKMDDDEFITKMEIGSEPEDSAKLEKEILPDDWMTYNVVRSGDTFIEMVHKSVDKKTGVTNVMSYIGTTREHVHVFGDSMNDLLMIKEFDGIAMGNALPIVKKYAKKITKSVSEDGVGYALSTWFKEY